MLNKENEPIETNDDHRLELFLVLRLQSRVLKRLKTQTFFASMDWIIRISLVLEEDAQCDAIAASNNPSLFDLG